MKITTSNLITIVLSGIILLTVLLAFLIDKIVIEAWTSKVYHEIDSMLENKIEE